MYKLYHYVSGFGVRLRAQGLGYEKVHKEGPTYSAQAACPSRPKGQACEAVRQLQKSYLTRTVYNVRGNAREVETIQSKDLFLDLGRQTYELSQKALEGWPNLRHEVHVYLRGVDGVNPSSKCASR